MKTQFQELVANGNATGEVVGVDRFLLKLKGLDGIAGGAMICFESGQLGIVRDVSADTVLVLNLNTESIPIGSLAVVQDNMPSAQVGEAFIGRVVSPLGVPLDGKGTIATNKTWPLFRQAPAIIERGMLNQQLPTGVTAVDSLFPIVLGQRIAIMGDTKSGKSAFLTQVGLNQKGTDRIVVYVLIGKRRVEIDQLLSSLEKSGAMAYSIVVIANIFDSLAQSYVAPYVGCAIAEYLWFAGRDVVIVYDDLSSHAKVYREISLLAEASPGRESYPGDMFYAHSSLLERAGKLAQNDKTLTALPVVLTPGDDITAYLPTSIMSITDGQIIFDLATFRQNIRPAVNSGLSVSRVGGRVQNARQKRVSGSLFKSLAAYREASEFSHFGSELAPETRKSLQLGQLIHEVFRQTPSELFSVPEQQLMLETVLLSEGMRTLNMPLLRKQVLQTAPATIKASDEMIDQLVSQLLQNVTVEVIAE